MTNIGTFLDLNRTLHQVDHSLAFLEAARPKLREALLGQMLPLLVERRRYQDIAELGGALKGWVDRRLKFCAWVHQHFFGPLGKNPDPARDLSEREIAVTGITLYYEAALGAGRVDDADEIEQRVLSFDAGPKTYAALIRHAARAGDPVRARRVASQGLAAVAEGQRSIILKALEAVHLRVGSISPQALAVALGRNRAWTRGNLRDVRERPQRG